MPSGNLSHYRADARTYQYVSDPASDLGQAERRRAQLLMRLAGLAKTGRTSQNNSERIADFGMGGGQMLALLNEAGLRSIGVDLAIENCIHARQARWPGQAIPVLAGDIYALPLKTGSISCAFVTEVLEHLPEPVHALMEVARVVRLGGRLVVSVPWREKIVEHLCIHCNRLTPANAHLHSIDETTLSAWLKQAGFDVREFVYFNNAASAPLQYSRHMRRFPFALWRAGDALMNCVLPRPKHFAALAVKQ